MDDLGQKSGGLDDAKYNAGYARQFSSAPLLLSVGSCNVEKGNGTSSAVVIGVQAGNVGAKPISPGPWWPSAGGACP
jgi:hypothetical protein